jgi:hypothetical protein
MGEIYENAPNVVEKAESIEKKDYINPYISLKELRECCNGNAELMEQIDRVVLSSLRYTETVIRFEEIIRQEKGRDESAEARKEIEEIRTRTHNVVIDDINILSRMFKNSGIDNSWIDIISNNGRPGYMKFAILLAFEAISTTLLNK